MSAVHRYAYTVRLADTDAARVVYFASILRICHEAYEDALAKVGIDLGNFLRESEIAIPIASCQARFLAPMYCSDHLWIAVKPELVKDSEFKLDYEITPAPAEKKILVIASTQHVCINMKNRSRDRLPDSIVRWIGCSTGRSPSF